MSIYAKIDNLPFIFPVGFLLLFCYNFLYVQFQRNEVCPMAFDGITIASIKSQLEERILMGRIYKISQPEQDELLITIKNQGKQYRLFLSASASLPLIYLTEVNKPSPLTAPGFCMLLRKHLQNGKIISISQPGLERIDRKSVV